MEQASAVGDAAEFGRRKGDLSDLAGILGVLQQDPAAWFEGDADEAFRQTVEGLIAERDQARAAKDWSAADRLRAELDALNIQVMDGPGRGRWRLKPR
jgi:cysteinyl-tRNA synthetase